MNLSKAVSMNILRGMVFVGLFTVLFFCLPAYARYSGGSCEPNDPYRIAIAQDLNDIGNHEEDWDKYFILVNDVNLAQYTGTQFKIIGRWINRNDPRNKPFTGIFDGNDHKIWNFTWVSAGRNAIGLFGYVGTSSKIKNLGLENVDVNELSGSYVGGLVGRNAGNIIDCYSTGKVSGTQYYIGGQGSNHINWLREIPGVRVVAICDADKNFLNREEKKFKGRGDGVKGVVSENP